MKMRMRDTPRWITAYAIGEMLIKLHLKKYAPFHGTGEYVERRQCSEIR